MHIARAMGDTIEVRLRHLGAYDIKKISGVLYFVKFQLESGIEVSYSYNINVKNQYFLQRIKPYPIPEGLFSDEEQIVEFIKQDLEKFKNAGKSKNFEQFVELTATLNQLTKDMEGFFLDYNVESEDLTLLVNELNLVRQTIASAKNHSKHVKLKS